MEACPNWHGGAGCPCDVLDLERVELESDECPECSCHVEDHNSPEAGGGCTVCGDCDAFVPEAPDHVDAIPFTLPPAAVAAAASLERAVQQATDLLRRFTTDDFTHFTHRLLIEFGATRAVLAVARSCEVCCPDVHRGRPAPLCIDGHAYRRRAKGRRR